MAYLGKSPVIGTFQKLDSFQGQQNNVTTQFSMSVSGTTFTPESVLQLMIVKDGIVLEPLVDYSTNGATLSFVDAPASNENIFIIAYGQALYSGIPSTGSVNNDKIASATIGYDKLSGDAISTILGDIITFGI